MSPLFGRGLGLMVWSPLREELFVAFWSEQKHESRLGVH